MALDILSVGLGLAVLLLAGDVLVKGAVNLSLRLGIPALIVGLTIVAFGTSAPELLVSIKAVLAGVPALALGNVVGSNVANILLVLGVPALIAAVPVARGELGRDYAIMVAASLLFIGLALAGPFGLAHGLVLLGALALMLGDAFLRARAHRNGRAAARAAEGEATALPDADAVLEVAEPGMSWLRIGIYIALGVAGLPLGAELLVDGAVNIARTLGMTEAFIGLTLVAVGTSLPELATTVIAAIRREAGVAMGNVLGSNVFNLLGIVGVTALVGPIPVPAQMLAFDLWVMLGAALLLAPFVWRGRAIGRPAGVGLTLLYVAYVAVLVAIGREG